jgi:hypothetical protein
MRWGESTHLRRMSDSMLICRAHSADRKSEECSQLHTYISVQSVTTSNLLCSHLQSVRFFKNFFSRGALVTSKREYVALFVFIALLSLLLSVILPGRSRAGNRDFICYWASSQLLEHGENPYDETAAIALEHWQGGFAGGGMVLQAPPTALSFVHLIWPQCKHFIWPHRSSRGCV